MPTISELPWLPPPQDDFADRVAAFRKGAGSGPEAVQLATLALNARQARRLARALGERRAQRADLAPLSPVRLVVLSNSTFDFIADHFPAAAARHGLALDLVLPPYDQVMQQALDPGSETAQANADFILLALDHRWFGLESPALKDPPAAVAAALGRLTSLLDGLAENTAATIILSTVVPPPSPLFGSLDARVAGTPRALVSALNGELVQLARDRLALVLDVAALAGRVGSDRWFDPVQHLACKLPFAGEFDAIYADTTARLIGSARGKARKCLVLDLDNTLWGGVVGDDGVENLILGQGSARGEAFLSVQRYALDLKQRGVILAISSKNDDAVARAAFSDHPEMLLTLEDVAVFQANWLDKASNLEAIAATLNIGIDAIVLMDDNPAERAQTRAALPMAAVPELPDDPAWFAWTLGAAGYFEAAAFSSDDLIRAESYAADASRAQVHQTARDLGDYLASLDMRLTAGPFDGPGRARISQLINKTNQFNLTTPRYSEMDVAAFQANADAVTMQVRLADRFGDMGMIGVIIAQLRSAPDGVREAWVDTWLMSCRVLGRRVEEAMLALLAERARFAGADRLVAEYRPTPKNRMVSELLDRLGFIRTATDVDGRASYALTLSTFAAATLPHEVVIAESWVSRDR